MICAMIAGRLIKHPTDDGAGRLIGSMAAFDGDRSVRFVCKTKHAEMLLALPTGAPVSMSGVLTVSAVMNDKGEPRAHLTLEVTAVVTTQPIGQMAN